MVWVWPYAAIWNSVREIGFRGATLCCGLVLVLCALRVHQHRAGPAITRASWGWPPASDGGPHPRSSTSSSRPSSCSWRVGIACTATAARRGPTLVRAMARRRLRADRCWASSSALSPGSTSNLRSGFASLHLRQSCATSVRLSGPACRSSSTMCSRRSWACGRSRVARGWAGAPSVTRSSWSSSSRWRSCWCVQRGWPGWVARGCSVAGRRAGRGGLPLPLCVLPHILVLGRRPLRRLPAAAPRAARRLVAPGRDHGGRPPRRPMPDADVPPGRAAVALASLGLAAGVCSTVVLAHESAGVPITPPGLLLRMVRSERGGPSGHPVHGRPSHPHRLRRLLDRLRPRLPGPPHGDGQPVALGRAALGQPGPDASATARPQAWLFFAPGTRGRSRGRLLQSRARARGAIPRARSPPT